MARNTGARIAIGSLAALSISLAATTAIVLADDELRGIALPGREHGTTVQVAPGSAPQPGGDITDARTQIPGNVPGIVGSDGGVIVGGAVGGDPSGDAAANPGPATAIPGPIVGPPPANPGPAPVNPGPVFGPAPADPGSPPPPVAEPPVVRDHRDEPVVRDHRN